MNVIKTFHGQPTYNISVVFDEAWGVEKMASVNKTILTGSRHLWMLKDKIIKLADKMAFYFQHNCRTLTDDQL